MDKLAALLLLAAPSFADLLPASIVSNFLKERSPSFEWTAWGDSYASGVGSGTYLGGKRCLRYDGAYPPQIDQDSDGLLPGQGGKFNNVVCSGATAAEVEEFQFYEKDEHNQPNRMYDPRPASGKPTIGTLTVGGDDIDFPGILSNCIVEGFPYPLSSGFTDRTCEDQRSLSWSLICQDGNRDLPNGELVAKFDSVIKKIVGWGHDAEILRLYVTGYGQFFNEDTTECDSVTFARTANPKNDGKPHIKMTRDLRKEYNQMSRTLNKAIRTAVEQNQDARVAYIDIDSLLPGHRFCEPGIKEPDQNNDNLYLWHYPYSQTSDNEDQSVAWLNKIAQDNVDALAWNPEKTLYRDYLNKFWDVVDDQSSTGNNFTSDDDVNAQWNPWPDSIGYRAKLFHPQVSFHKAIYEAIIKQYNKDSSEDPDSTGPSSSSASSNATASQTTLSSAVSSSVSSSAPTTTTTFSPPVPALNYKPGTCKLHVDQYEIACLGNDKNYQANVVIRDDGDNIIGQTDGEEGSYPSINDGDPLRLQSKLQGDLVVTGEHNGDDGDHVQFTLETNPGLSWTSQTSSDDQADSYCKVGGWDPKGGSSCSQASRAGVIRKNSKRQMDCWFKC